MTSSNLILLTFCVLFFTINIAAADEQCSFSYTSGLGASVGLPNTYTCKVYNTSELPQVNAHRPGLNDLNVTYVEVNFDGFYDEFTQFYCLSFPNLKQFRIENIKINKFDENFFNLCGKLSHISISSNGLKELPEDLFAGSPNVQELGISDNNLETLPENIFSNLNQLTSLHLDRNQIKNLPPKIFSPLTKMAVLSLSGNQITSVNPRIFQNIPNLEYVFMGNNKIQEIQDNAFAGLPKLRNLHLDYNNIKKLNRNSFANLKKITSLSLSGNNLESFPSSVFEPLEDITILSLDKNQIREVQGNWFGSKKNRIFVLDMSSNKIDRIDRRLFDKIEPTHLLVKGNVCVDAEIRRASKEERDEMLKRCYKNLNETGDDDRIVFPGK